MSRGSEVAAVGIDLGGTSFKIGRLDEQGGRGESNSLPTDLERGPQDLVARMAAAARSLGRVQTVGLAVPGLLDRAGGRVISSPNLAPLAGFPLVQELAARLDLPPEAIRFENDANAAAFGEHALGAGRDVPSFLLATLGTGVGGGLVLDGELIVGDGGMAGEIGHVCVEPGGPLCGCGNRGCLEALASATAARRRAREAGLDDDLEALSASARAAAGPERDLLLEIGRDLGRGLAAALVLLDVRTFLIGGGFGAAYDVLKPGILAGVLERSYGRAASELAVEPASLGADAGWIGAAALARRELAR